MKNVGVQSMQGPMEGYLVSSPQSEGHRMVFSPHLFLQKGSQVCQIDRKPFVTGRDPGQGSSYHKACERFNSFWKIIFLVEVAGFGENPTPGDHACTEQRLRCLVVTFPAPCGRLLLHER